MPNIVDPDQTFSVIWVYTVCKDLCDPMSRVPYSCMHILNPKWPHTEFRCFWENVKNIARFHQENCLGLGYTLNHMFLIWPKKNIICYNFKWYFEER